MAQSSISNNRWSQIASDYSYPSHLETGLCFFSFQQFDFSVAPFASDICYRLKQLYFFYYITWKCGSNWSIVVMKNFTFYRDISLQQLKKHNDDEHEMATRLLLRIFLIEPRLRGFFYLSDVPYNELRSSYIFQQHVKVKKNLEIFNYLSSISLFWCIKIFAWSGAHKISFRCPLAFLLNIFLVS